jgi:hypothetical protein
MLPDAQPKVAFGKLLIDDRMNSKKIGIGCLIVAAAIIAFAVVTAAAVPARPNLPRRGIPVPILVAFGGFVGLGVAVLGAVVPIKGDRHTMIYEQGVVQETKDGIRALRFDDVAAFRCFIAYGKAAQIGFRFIASDEQPDSVGDISWTAMRGPKMAKAEELRVYLTKVFATRMLEKLKAGSWVWWGDGRITPTGIELDGRSIRWKEISRIKIRNSGSTVISSSDQGNVSIDINSANFWPGFSILKRQLDPSIFA